MFKRKNDDMCKVVLIVVGAVVAAGGAIFGLIKLKKRKSVEKECEEECCSCYDEEDYCQEGCCCNEEEIEYVDEEGSTSEGIALLTEEEVELLTK